MEKWLMEIINNYGYIGIMFLIAFENIFPPVPSEVILTFGGFMTTMSSMHIAGVIVASTIGSVLGAIVLYLVGVQLNTNRLEKLVAKWGKLLRVTMNDVDRAEDWFNKYGAWTVFFCRFIPVIRSLISIPAGMTKMNVGIFLVFTSLGTLIWNTVLISLGAAMGESWDVIIERMEIYQDIIYGALFVLIIVGCIVYVRKKR